MLLGVGHGTTLFAHQHQVADLVQHPSGPLNPAMLLKFQFRLLLWEIIAPIDHAPDWVRENARPRCLHASFAQLVYERHVGTRRLTGSIIPVSSWSLFTLASSDFTDIVLITRI